MRTIRIKLYKFNELSETAKQKAIDEWRNNNYDDSSLAWEQIKDDAKEIGLKIISLDDNRPNKGEFMLAANEVAQNILNTHGKDCETYKTASSFMEEWQPVFGNYMDESNKDYESQESEEKLMELEDEFLKSLLEDYRIMYNTDIEYQNSDEYITETIEVNNYEFTEDGKLNY